MTDTTAAATAEEWMEFLSQTMVLPVTEDAKLTDAGGELSKDQEQICLQVAIDLIRDHGDMDAAYIHRKVLYIAKTVVKEGRSLTVVHLARRTQRYLEKVKGNQRWAK